MIFLLLLIFRPFWTIKGVGAWHSAKPAANVRGMEREKCRRHPVAG